MAEPLLKRYATPPNLLAEFLVRVQLLKLTEEPVFLIDTTPPYFCEQKSRNKKKRERRREKKRGTGKGGKMGARGQGVK